VKLIVQPDAGVAPIVTAIKGARKSIDILIFRLDRRDVAEALATAVKRGVAVRALIAHTNRGGEKNLRKLELQLLASGVTVSRTAGDLVRYHGKMLIIDRRLLHVLGFNYTSRDLRQTRSFAIVTRRKRYVDEALKLFESDCARQPYRAGYDRFIVSPENSRERLTAFIAGARKQLCLYDPRIGDPAILRALAERHRAGVDVRIIGKLGGRKSELRWEKYPGKRLHVRAIVRDGRHAFLGSQSLRKLELDRRREIGIIVDDALVVKGMLHVFEQDWALTPSAKQAEHAATHDPSVPVGAPAVVVAGAA
jgi:phosphatidylserine/phosphatidylglycerophosphate/cardiolipin synthase-like enzyme